MITLSPALAECIESIGATLTRIERTLQQSAKDEAKFRVELAAMLDRLEKTRKR